MSAREYIRQAYRFLLPLLYGRTRFKLFLKTSLEDIDLTVRQIACVTDSLSPALRPIRIHPPFGKSMLVIAPHQDDETIGCGGVMALQARSGGAVSIVLLTDGAFEADQVGMTRQELTALRNQESRSAAAALGVQEPIFLDHPDLVAEPGRIADQLAEILRSRKIDVVFTPFLLDGHFEHRQANSIVAQALGQAGGNIRVLGYEVWGFAIPNVIVAIDDVMELKTRALECFHFANRAVDYTWTTRGVNMYRSRLTEVGICRYAECFFETPAEEFIELAGRIQAAELASLPATS